MRIAYHRKQRFVAPLSIYDPVGVEYLMTAVFRVGLREHHQFDVGRIAFQSREVLPQIVDLVVRERQSHAAIGALKRVYPARQNVDGLQLLRLELLKELLCLIEIVKHGLRHAIMDER